MTAVRSVCIGFEAEANFDESIAVGYRSKTSRERQVVIGNEHSQITISSSESGRGRVLIGDVDIVYEISRLQEQIKEQQKLIDALWYAPGMPGYQERLANFNNFINSDCLFH
jgi:hypothetical protein